MSDLEPGMQSREQHLMTLRGELARRGVTCDLRDGGGQPRPPVWYPGASTVGDEPLDSVAAAFLRAEWWYCWPHVTPISPVAPVSRAAEAIISELRLGDGTGKGGQAADLLAWRMLRRARLEIFRPYAPGAASARRAAAPGRVPGSGCPSAGPHGRRADGVRPGGTMPPGGQAGGSLRAVAAELAIAGFEADVVDRCSDGQPRVLAVTSPATGTCAEVTAHGTELELRCWSDPAGVAGLITAQVTAVLTASAGDDTPGRPLAAAGWPAEAGQGERRVLLARLQAGLAGLGVRASPQPGGQSLGIWPGLYAGVSQDARRYGWTAESGIRTHPVGDADGAARRIAACRDMLAGGAMGWLV
jgi:hypothetical protein